MQENSLLMIILSKGIQSRSVLTLHKRCQNRIEHIFISDCYSYETVSEL